MPLIRSIVAVNSWFEDACEGAGHALHMLWRAVGYIALAPKKREAIVAQMFKAVFGSIAIVLLTGLFSGMILGLQSGIELQKYGQESSIGFLVTAGMFREMGPVMTAIALAGLIGSTYAAEIGTMKVGEELDALEVMSIDPVYFLTMPRLIALLAAALGLTLVSDLVGTLGGAIVGKAYLNVSFDVYFQKAQEVLKLRDIYGGMLKTSVFAVTITTIACSQGMRATHGAEGVGTATMRTVVFSFVYILMFDYLIGWALY